MRSKRTASCDFDQSCCAYVGLGCQLSKVLLDWGANHNIVETLFIFILFQNVQTFIFYFVFLAAIMGITFSCHNLAQCSLNTNLMMQSVRKCLKSSTYQGIRSSGLWSKQCAFCYDLTLNDADLIAEGIIPFKGKWQETLGRCTVFHSTIKVTFCSKFILTVHEAFLVFWLQFLQSASARLSARRNSQLMPAPHLWSE